MSIMKIESFSYYDELVASNELWADRLEYSGGTVYAENAPLYRPDGFEVSTDFNFTRIEEWKCEEGEKPCVHSVVNQDWPRFYSENMRASVHEFERAQDIGGIKLCASRDNITVTVEVSDEGLFYFPVGTATLEKAGNAEFVSFIQPARKFIRLVCEPEDREEQLDFFPHEIITADLFSSESFGGKEPAIGTVDMGIGYKASFVEPYSEKGEELLVPLSGTWKMTDDDISEYWKTDIDVSGWLDMPVPGDPDHHFSTMLKRHNEDKKSAGAQVIYKQRITVPNSFEGQRVILRVENAVSYARVFVNGCFIRSHRGAMLPFDCDITDAVKAGMDAEITISCLLERKKPDFTMARGLAGYVWLFALPKSSLSVLRTTTDLTDDLSCGLLTVREKVHHFEEVRECTVSYSLYDADKNPVELELLSEEYLEDGSISKKYKVNSPKLWSAEEPELYSFEARLCCDGKCELFHRRKVGFRSIRIVGNRLLVNGNEEKLHGVNWMTHSAFEGISASYECDRESLIKFKAANVNYIRTCHNPQRRYVHEICDELGIYVEEEMSTVFVSRWVPNTYEGFDFLVNPKFQPVFIEGYAEMMANAASNVSILFYSLANESDWSVNVEAARDYLRIADPERPHKFSWGYSHPAGAVELQSEHYTPIQWMGGISERPVIYDEHAHTIGENIEKIESDPSHRDMYAFRLRDTWERIYSKAGGLGIAIWNGRGFAAIKNGEHGAVFSHKWGELDLWERPNPEFWHVKKVFTPVYIDETVTYTVPSYGKKLQIPVQNRYCQTSFADIKLYCAVNGEETVVKVPMLEAGERGYIDISRDAWNAGDKVELYFYKDKDRLGNTAVEQYELILERKAPKLPFKPIEENIGASIFETQVEAQMNAGSMHFWFGRTDGLIHGGKFCGKTVVKQGPFLNFGSNMPLTFKSADSTVYTSSNGVATVTSRQFYEELKEPVSITQKFFENGKLEITFKATLPEEHKIDEFGVTLRLKDVVRQLWEKNSKIFTSYPKDHIGRLKGDIARNRAEGIEEKLSRPTWQWNDDEFEFQLREKGDFGCTRDFRAAKRDYYYVAAVRADGIALAALSGGNGGSVRFELSQGDVLMHINSDCGSKTPGEFAPLWEKLAVESGECSGTVTLQFFKIEEKGC